MDLRSPRSNFGPDIYINIIRMLHHRDDSPLWCNVKRTD